MAEHQHPCRSCGARNIRTFLDLGETPLADALLDEPGLESERRYPLQVAFCPECALVQILEDVDPGQLFVENYHYFSSFSDDVNAHAQRHAQSLTATRKLGTRSRVVEIASNDGYLLRHFAEMGIPVLGIDPSPGPAMAAEAAGIRTMQEFFGVALAEKLREHDGPADVIIANNVMAHVPDLNGFVAGLRILVADDGVITIENPYVRDLIEHCEFDTIYHEHFCYFSCTAVDALVRRHGLFLNHVEYFPKLHGGTLRWWIGPNEEVSEETKTFLTHERTIGVTEPSYYASFGERVARNQRELRELLRSLKLQGKRLAAYGAAAKGSTLLNATGIGSDLLDFVVDRNVHKHGKFMPGVHLPIRPPSALLEEQPDFVVLLAWNFKEEVMAQQQEYRQRGGRFIVPVPFPAIV